MANHQSARKRIRVNQSKRLRNRYQLKTCKTAMKQLKQTKDKQVAAELLKSISARLDKLAMKHILHKNKAARSKSNLAKHINNL